MLKEGVGGECEVDSRTTPARTRAVTAPALSYKQGLGSGESGDSLSSRASRAGSVRSRFIWIGKEADTN